ncbi:MAG: hypothetical protein ACLQT6_05420 [Desulfomonilaceae bacterium]
MNVSRPSMLLQKLSDDYPGIWKHVESFRSDRWKTLPKWADWCFLFLAAAYSIASGGSDNRLPMEKMIELSRIGALAAWRVTHGIFRFDQYI